MDLLGTQPVLHGSAGYSASPSWICWVLSQSFMDLLGTQPVLHSSTCGLLQPVPHACQWFRCMEVMIVTLMADWRKCVQSFLTRLNNTYCNAGVCCSFLCHDIYHCQYKKFRHAVDMKAGRHLPLHLPLSISIAWHLCLNPPESSTGHGGSTWRGSRTVCRYSISAE
jgi:hypothetical protein